jgi:hypothetical protein
VPDVICLSEAVERSPAGELAALGPRDEALVQAIVHSVEKLLDRHPARARLVDAGGLSAARGLAELADEQLEGIARRAAELVRADPAGLRLVDARTLADALGVSRDTVYEHAEALGGRRIGSGPRGRLRFELDAALEGWTHRSSRRDPPEPQPAAGAGKTRSRRGRSPGSSARLLPVHREQADLSAEE